MLLPDQKAHMHAGHKILLSRFSLISLFVFALYLILSLVFFFISLLACYFSNFDLSISND